MSPRRILLLARDMVGDLVNTTGAVTWIRQAFPDADIVIEGGSASPSLFPSVKVKVRQRHGGLVGKLRRVAAFRQGKFDLAIILDDSREATRLVRAAGIGTVVVPTSTGGHDLFVPLTSVLRQVAERFGVRFSEDALKPVIPLGDANPTHSHRVILHVGASDIAKQWPEENWIELASHLDCILAAGPGEEGLLERIANASGRPRLPSLSLLEYAAVLEQAQVLVTGDTGPAHLAAAVGTLAVVLYGPTDPARFHPWGTKWVALRHPMGCDHYGSGCAFNGANGCSQTCIRSISVQEVREALTQVLA